MIQEITIPFLLKDVFALAHNIPDTTPEKFKDMVLERLAEKDSVVIVEKKDQEIRGFLFCTTDRFNGGLAYVIQFAYVKPDAYNAGAELMARACQLAKGLGLKDIYMMTSRKPEAFERKYKFEQFRYILKRSV